MATVLIVEDDFLVAHLLSDDVTDAGHTVMGPAASLDEALRIAQPNPPHVALVDCRLRGRWDGVALAGPLRKLGIVVIYVTGEVEAVRRADPVAVVVAKPYDPHELLRTIESATKSPPRG